MPQLGPQYDLATRLSMLEDLVRKLAGNQLGQAFSATQSDGSVGLQIQQNIAGAGATVTQWFQGPTTARDPSTGQHPLLVYIGEVFVSGVSQDSAALFYRASGRESMVAGDRGVQIIDPAGFQVFGTDEYGSSPSNKGLNSPWIAYGAPLPADALKWPQTTSTSLAEVSVKAFPAQHANIRWNGSTYCPAGTTGEVQVQVNNGASGAVHSVGAGFTALDEVIPLGSWSWQEVLTMAGNAAVTSGAGPIYLGITGVWGQGSGF